MKGITDGIKYKAWYGATYHEMCRTTLGVCECGGQHIEMHKEM
jgi:hypothetical protein